MRGVAQRKTFRSLHVSLSFVPAASLAEMIHRIYLFISAVFFVYNGFPPLGDALGLAGVSGPRIIFHPFSVTRLSRNPGTVTHQSLFTSQSSPCPA